MLKITLDWMICESMEKILNAIPDAEVDEIIGVARYERSGDRKADRAGRYSRDLRQGRQDGSEDPQAQG